METKRERFVRIVEARTNKIISMMRLLGNCANKANYDYTEADVQKIFTALEKEIKLTNEEISSLPSTKIKLLLEKQKNYCSNINNYQTK